MRVYPESLTVDESQPPIYDVASRLAGYAALYTGRQLRREFISRVGNIVDTVVSRNPDRPRVYRLIEVAPAYLCLSTQRPIASGRTVAEPYDVLEAASDSRSLRVNRLAYNWQSSDWLQEPAVPSEPDIDCIRAMAARLLVVCDSFDDLHLEPLRFSTASAV